GNAAQWLTRHHPTVQTVSVRVLGVVLSVLTVVVVVSTGAAVPAAQAASGVASTGYVAHVVAQDESTRESETSESGESSSGEPELDPPTEAARSEGRRVGKAGRSPDYSEEPP